MVDEPTAVRDLMAHLIKLGHRRIGHIKGHPDHGACAWRHAGYRAALKAAGIAYDPKLVVEGEFTFESGVNGARRLLDLKEPPTAIFAANDDMAAGVLRVAGERGLSVPRDLSVCGFDDTPLVPARLSGAVHGAPADSRHGPDSDARIVGQHPQSRHRSHGADALHAAVEGVDCAASGRLSGGRQAGSGLGHD